MSNWTHVAGIIRVDAPLNIEDFFESNFSLSTKEGELRFFDRVVGKECHWGDPYSTWKDYTDYPNLYMPGGSEGTLYKKIWINDKSDCSDRYTVSIFGDLRDHDSCDDIIAWFKETCDKFLIVRQGIITVHNEWLGIRDYRYVEDE